jgi:hypothetical protein
MVCVAEISTYHLLFEMLKEGRGDLYPQLEPIPLDVIAAALAARTGKNFGTDAERWITWFLKGKILSENDRANLSRIKKLVDMERKYIPRIEKDRGEQKH